MRNRKMANVMVLESLLCSEAQFARLYAEELRWETETRTRMSGAHESTVMALDKASHQALASRHGGVESEHVWPGREMGPITLPTSERTFADTHLACPN